MKKTSIYSDRSQELPGLFEKAGNRSKLMCVPIDYAKKDHLVMFGNGNGEVERMDDDLRRMNERLIRLETLLEVATRNVLE